MIKKRLGIFLKLSHNTEDYFLQKQFVTNSHIGAIQILRHHDLKTADF